MELNRTSLVEFEARRAQILSHVAAEAVHALTAGRTPAALDLLLSEVLYDERLRVAKSRCSVFTRARRKRDLARLSRLAAGLKQSLGEADRQELLAELVRGYAEEIGGHFSSAVYRFATRVVPFGFSWLLNAASVGRFVPWRMTQSLESRLRISGEVAHLKRLSERGTILLVPTHQSNIDSVLIGYVIYLMGLPPFAYGAGLNLFSNPVLSFFLSRLGAYTVDRAKQNPIYKEVLKTYSAQILREGVHSIFFPGGGRSRSGAIEQRVKLGLLGTGLEAAIRNRIEGRERPDIFVVPMVMSYHFVLEAASLIEDHLIEHGKHRVLPADDEGWAAKRVLGFFWKLFASESTIEVRIGRPLDVFGNFVDEEGRSLGPDGRTLDPTRWMRSHGEIRLVPQRDREYTRALGERLVERYRAENTVLSSHAVAYALFACLRKQYPGLDLFRLLRLSPSQRAVNEATFLPECERVYAGLREGAAAGKLYLATELSRPDVTHWVAHGIDNLGLFHDAKVVRREPGIVTSDDLNLLYYYRNRLEGYGFLA